MLPDPLHPAIVHFPIVLVVLFPIVALAAIWAIRRGTPPRRAWSIPVVLAAALTLSAWAATETGEAQEERVEEVVGDDPMHAHEEAAERVLLLSGVLLLLTGTGLLGGDLGRAGRALSTVGAVGLIVAGARVGATGGDLVYRHGAAEAYADPGVGRLPTAEAGEGL